MGESIECLGCGQALEDALTGVDRPKCPTCGSILRQVNVTVTTAITIRTGLKLSARKKGAKKPHYEISGGASLHRKTGIWMDRQLLIDRDSNRYSECVTNPMTGEVIHKCDEPLSEHRGHGSAKSKGSVD